YAVVMRQFLTNTFPNRWITRCGVPLALVLFRMYRVKVAWSDFTPPYVYVCVYVSRDKDYAAVVRQFLTDTFPNR
ncbi:hypothetical protein EAI_10413, partial [Harpegnathos saltator]